jgi:hypothetical protein
MTDEHLKRANDPNQLANSIIDRVTGQQPSPIDSKDPEAATPDHKAGLMGELARATSLTPEQRAEIAKKPTKK